MKTLNSLTSICISFLIFLLLSNFNMVYAQWQKTFVDTLTPGVRFPIVADINDDGDMDILVVRQTGEDVGEILWYECPDWTKHVVEYDLGAVKAVDLNNDNKIDMVAANMTAGEVVWYEAPSWTRHVIGTLSDAVCVEVVDLDKDGDLDVVATAVDPNKIVWYEAPSWAVTTIEEETSDPVFVFTVDIDGDDDIDIIVTASGGIFLFEAPAWTKHKITDFSGIIDTGDIDGDGDLDIAFATGANVFWYENPTWTQHVINADLLGAMDIALADLNKDGDIDVIASGSQSDEVAWYESPTWIKHVIDDSLDGAFGLSAADMDGDGKTDLVACGKDAGDVVFYKSDVTSVPSDDIATEIPKSYKLYQNYPNPFNPTTTIEYNIQELSFVTLKIYDVLGSEIETLVNEKLPAGIYEVEFNSHSGLSLWGEVRNLPSGVYFYQIRAGDFIETKKML